MKKLLLAIPLIWLIICLTGCSIDTQPTTRQVETQTAEQTQQKLMDSVKIPNLTTSSERANVSKRAEIFNNEEKISYIYLVSFGKVMSFYAIKGKVSSLRSYLIPETKLVYGNGGTCQEGSTNYPSCYQVDAPDLDGTYGENVAGIFFFTTEGAYVEWNGDYLMSDQPLKLSTQPELIRQIK